MTLRKLIQDISDGIADVASLEVNTYTGSLATTDLQDGRVDWSKMGMSEGKLVLVAATRLRVDFDSDYFQTSDEVTGRADLIEAHHRTVEIARDARLAFLSTFIKLPS